MVAFAASEDSFDFAPRLIEQLIDVGVVQIAHLPDLQGAEVLLVEVARLARPAAAAGRARRGW